MIHKVPNVDSIEKRTLSAVTSIYRWYKHLFIPCFRNNFSVKVFHAWNKGVTVNSTSKYKPVSNTFRV